MYTKKQQVELWRVTIENVVHQDRDYYYPHKSGNVTFRGFTENGKVREYTLTISYEYLKAYLAKIEAQ